MNSTNCFTSALLLVIIFSTGCQDRYYRTKTGLLFKVISNSKDSFATIGTTAKINYIQKAGDTIIESTYDKMPLYYTIMPGYGNRYNPLEVFDYGLREGDSVVTIQRVDSMMHKKIFDSLPSYLKGDDEWYTYMKVEKIFDNDSMMIIDKLMEEVRVNGIQEVAGRQRVERYLQQHNIPFQKNDGGGYVQFIEQGQGALIDSGKHVGLKFVFTTLRGRIFDSNRDTSFHHNDTLSFVVGSGFMPKAIEEGLKLLQPGGQAKIYLPTMTAFGGKSSNKNIRPYEDVVFDVEVLTVKDKNP